MYFLSFGRGRALCERLVRADGVVLCEPDGDRGLGLADGVKPFRVQHRAAQRAVDALIVAVRPDNRSPDRLRPGLTPRAAGIDLERGDADLGGPVLKLLGEPNGPLSEHMRSGLAQFGRA